MKLASQAKKLAAALVLTGVAAAVINVYHSDMSAAFPAPSSAVSTSAAMQLPDFTQLVNENAPAVVNITAVFENPQEQPPESLQLPPGIPKDSPFYWFFKRFGAPEIPNPAPTAGLGSGFIISSDGYILTNAHVVDHAKKVTVKLSDKREFPAKVVGLDKLSDVALVKIDATGLPTVKIGDANSLKVGQWVLAIGAPFGFDHSATQGIVSALGRSLPDDTYVPFIQTDVPINPGNSGGPLIDLSGRVVGINSQIYSRTGGYMGLSFSIPINVAMNVADQLKEHGHVIRGWLGIELQQVNQDLAKSFGMDKPRGALVANVTDKSPAKRAGIKTGDIIVAYNGKAINDSSDLPPLVGSTKPGASVPVTVIRDGKEVKLNVRIGKLPENGKVRLGMEQPGSGQAEQLGIAVSDLTPAQRKELGVTHGVLVQDVGPGIALDAGIEPGDVLLKLNNVDIVSVAQLKRLVNSLPTGKPVPLLVKRHDTALFLALTLPGKHRG